MNDLNSDELVRETNYQSVFWSVVLVLGLRDQFSSGEVISLSFSSSSEFGLVTTEVG